MSDKTSIPHAHVHVDIEEEAGPGLAISFLVSTSFTRPGRCVLHAHVYEGEERLLERVETLGDGRELAAGPLAAMTPTIGTLVGGEVAASGNGSSVRVADLGTSMMVAARAPDFTAELTIERDQPRIGSVSPGTDSPLAWVGEDGYFSYRMAVPRGRAHGIVRLADGTSWEIGGRAYVDEQWGTRHFAAAIGGWEWYRVDTPDERIYVMTDVLHDGRRRRRGVIVGDSGATIVDDVERSAGPSFAPREGKAGRLVDRLLDREITLELGPLLADDDLARASGGRVDRFYRRSTRYAVAAPGADPVGGNGRVGVVEFPDLSR